MFFKRLNILVTWLRDRCCLCIWLVFNLDDVDISMAHRKTVVPSMRYNTIWRCSHTDILCYFYDISLNLVIGLLNRISSRWLELPSECNICLSLTSHGIKWNVQSIIRFTFFLHFSNMQWEPKTLSSNVDWMMVNYSLEHYFNKTCFKLNCDISLIM